MKSLYGKDFYLMDSDEDWEGILLLSVNTADQARRKNYLSHGSINMSMNYLWPLSSGKQKTSNHQKREQMYLSLRVCEKDLDDVTPEVLSSLIVLSKHS